MWAKGVKWQSWYILQVIIFFIVIIFPLFLFTKLSHERIFLHGEVFSSLQDF